MDNVVVSRVSRGASAGRSHGGSAASLPGVEVLQRSWEPNINFTLVVVGDAWDVSFKTLVDIDMTTLTVFDVVHHSSEIDQR